MWCVTEKARTALVRFPRWKVMYSGKVFDFHQKNDLARLSLYAFRTFFTY